MSLNFNRFLRSAGTFVGFALAITLLLSSAFLLAQTTVGSGSISGNVTDPTGAVVSGAKVVVTNTGTAQTQTLTTNASGDYSSGPLDPGIIRCRSRPRDLAALSRR